jgi:antirestriction protein ArdC
MIMSKQKALFEQIADALVYQLNAGTSPLQKPWVDNGANFAIPVNASTGNQYKGMNALWLAMQNKVDPRWMTLKQASLKEMTVETGAKATMINFIKTSEMRPLRGDKGEVLRDEENKLKYETVDLDDAVLVNAWLFNGEQIQNIPDWSEVAAELSELPVKPAVDRITDLAALSGAEIKHGAIMPFYDPAKDIIHMPEVDAFESVEKYQAALLHELIHWSGHESRLGRETGAYGSEAHAKEELRANIASLFLGSELNISHELGQHSDLVGSWVQILQQEPFELHRAASDAQRILDTFIGLESNRELNIAVSPRVQQNFLNQGDLIPHKNNEYKVQGVMKGNTAQMMEMTTGRRFKISPKDGLYSALVSTRNALAEDKKIDAAANIDQAAGSDRQVGRGQKKAEGVDQTSGYDGVDHEADTSVNTAVDRPNSEQAVGAGQEQTATVGTEVKEEVTQRRSRGR